MADVHAVVNDKFRIIEDASAKNIYFHKEINIITNVNLSVTYNERHFRERKPLTDRLASASKQRLSIKISGGPAQQGHDSLMQGVKRSQSWDNEPRQRE